jgi:hypothetical protein
MIFEDQLGMGYSLEITLRVLFLGTYADSSVSDSIHQLMIET